MDLGSYKWVCTCCGKQMAGLPGALAFESPHNWNFLDEASHSSSRLDDDFCLIESSDGDHERYIRCCLNMPLLFEDGSFGEFQFGVWMSVSKASLDVYSEGFDTGVYAKQGCFGYLSNQIPSYPDCLNLHADVNFRLDNLRPLVILHDGDNDLIRDQKLGMKVEILESLIARHKH